MDIQLVSSQDWLRSGRPSETSGEWLGIGHAGSRLASMLADDSGVVSSSAEDVVILRRGVVGRTATVLTQLPGTVAALAAPVSDEDLVLIRAARTTELRPANGTPSLAEWLFHTAAAGATLRWLSVPPDAEDDARALPRLAPGNPATEHRWQLSAVRQVVALHPQSASRTEALALEAGLLQLGDWLDESHRASQSIEGEGRDRNGDYWHAIMHRREPDYGNSKYWFRHVGRHPIFPTLMEAAGEVLGSGPVEIAQEWRKRLISRGQWDPFACVDLCQAAATDEDSALTLTARRIQLLEMLLLVKHCWDGA